MALLLLLLRFKAQPSDAAVDMTAYRLSPAKTPHGKTTPL